MPIDYFFMKPALSCSSNEALHIMNWLVLEMSSQETMLEWQEGTQQEKLRMQSTSKCCSAALSLLCERTKVGHGRIEVDER